MAEHFEDLTFDSVEHGGFFGFLSRPSATAPMLTSFSAEGEHAALVFGDLDLEDGAPADVIRRIWARDGVDGVRTLEGRFGAALWHTNTGELILVSDLMGLRSLRHASTQNGELVVSNFDVCLFATGDVSAECNPLGLASSVLLSWPIAKTTQWRNVHAHDPTEVVSWRDGVLSHRPTPLVDWRYAGSQDSAHHITDALLHRVKRRLRGEERVVCDLTAGLDSRAALASVLASGFKGTIIARSGGSGVDTETAERIARRLGIVHEVASPPTRSFDELTRLANQVAILTNGEAEARYAASQETALNAPIHITGHGGEQFRTHYQRPQDLIASSSDTARYCADAVLERSWRRRARPSLHRELEKAFRLQLIERMRKLGTPGAFDTLQAFYIFERHGRWASRAPRQSGYPNRLSAFDSSLALFHVGGLSPRALSTARVHRRLLDALPAIARWWPVNEGLPPIASSSLASRAVSRMVSRVRGSRPSPVRGALEQLNTWITRTASESELVDELAMTGELDRRVANSLCTMELNRRICRRARDLAR